MALSDIITMSITTGSTKIERAGYGVPLILAADCPVGFTERVRFYTSITGVLVDFATTTATYKMAATVFAQNPKLPRLAVGRIALKPTQRWAMTPIVGGAAVTNYKMRISGLIGGVYTESLISVDSDASPTVTEVIALLKTAIDALSLAVTVSDQTTFMRIVANTAGAFFSVESLDTSKIKVAQDNADPGYATDLGAIQVEDNTWYAVLNPFNSQASAIAIAGWVESAKKLFIAQTQDSDVINLSNSSDTGGSITVAGSLKASTRFRTALIYHPKTDAFADAAWAGATMPSDPGSETWAYKTLSGPAVTTLTSTQRTNALAKHANVYEQNAGANYTYPGTVSGNEYIDVIRFRDWLESTMSEEIFAAFLKASAAGKKIPFTDGGIATIEGIVRNRLKAGVAIGGLADDPAPTVTVPLAANVSSADKAARTLTGVQFDAILAGAIQATSITGFVSV